METFLSQQSLWVLIVLFILSLYLLSRFADHLIDNAVALSEKMGISQAVVGATVVSLGTTLPELSTSVAAVLQDTTGFALGNAVGSVITNTSLVLGVGALVGKLPVQRHISKRVIFFTFVGLLLTAGSFFGFDGSSGTIPSWLGLVFLLLVPLYLWFSFRNNRETSDAKHAKRDVKAAYLLQQLTKIILSAVLVAVSSTVLVSTVKVGAERVGVSESVIAATIVALGTSLPELSTTFAAARKGHGELAVGNVMGANILNILLVLGVAVFMTPAGLAVNAPFFYIQYPVMLVIIMIFNYFVFNTKKNEIDTREGLFLMVIYLLFLMLNLFV